MGKPIEGFLENLEEILVNLNIGMILLEHHP